MENPKNAKRQALRAAFPHTIPVLAGYIFLGMTYGIYMNASGFGLGLSLLMSVAVFAGSMQFVAVELLSGAFDLLQAFLMTLMINARHIFYGFSMLEKYRGRGWKSIYLIFGMSDESFSVTCSAEPPEGVDRGWFMFFITLLDQSYWVAGTLLGVLFGSLLHFSLEGLDFVMTAMFVVIFLEQWLKEKNHASSLLGLGLSLLCLLLFGAEDFILPAMAAILLMLSALRKPLEKGGACS